MQAPTPLQMDALRELANVGCAHAANALSQLVGGQRVDIGVPDVRLSTVEQLPELVGGPSTRVVAAALEMTGQLTGQLMLVLPELDGLRLAGLLLNVKATDGLSDLGRSALSEVANILASACMTAIGTLTGLKLLPTVPSLMQDTAERVLPKAFQRPDGNNDPVLVMDARFRASTAPHVNGQLLLSPDPKSLSELFARLGV